MNNDALFVFSIQQIIESLPQHVLWLPNDQFREEDTTVVYSIYLHLMSFPTQQSTDMNTSRSISIT